MSSVVQGTGLVMCELFEELEEVSSGGKEEEVF